MSSERKSMERVKEVEGVKSKKSAELNGNTFEFFYNRKILQ